MSLHRDHSSEAPSSFQKRFTLGETSLGLSEYLNPVFKRLQTQPVVEDDAFIIIASTTAVARGFAHYRSIAFS